ncbi:hypothetical protein ACBJ59_60460 [Nonomuraea sp. MTCD27]|uniref:hypothetical protein n=1 Tax=Nonomuraea sp. MTCD27 TaxID=1676747 RepID=UPI0035C0D2E2
MAVTTSIWQFALIVGLLTLTSGLDTTLILRTAALGRRRSCVGQPHQGRIQVLGVAGLPLSSSTSSPRTSSHATP